MRREAPGDFFLAQNELKSQKILIGTYSDRQQTVF